MTSIVSQFPEHQFMLSSGFLVLCTIFLCKPLVAFNIDSERGMVACQACNLDVSGLSLDVSGLSLDVSGLSLSGSNCFSKGESPGKALQSPIQVLTKPRTNIDNVSFHHYMTEIMLKVV